MSFSLLQVVVENQSLKIRAVYQEAPDPNGR